MKHRVSKVDGSRPAPSGARGSIQATKDEVEHLQEKFLALAAATRRRVDELTVRQHSTVEALQAAEERYDTELKAKDRLIDELRFALSVWKRKTFFGGVLFLGLLFVLVVLLLGEH